MLTINETLQLLGSITGLVAGLTVLIREIRVWFSRPPTDPKS